MTRMKPQMKSATHPYWKDWSVSDSVLCQLWALMRAMPFRREPLKSKTIILILTLLCLAFSPAPAAFSQFAAIQYTATGLRVADYLLDQQNADGAIPDALGGEIVNEDSNMEYALMGLAAAYWQSGETHYLDGLERGIAWLAAREEMSDPFWRGSWMYAYASTPPYSPVPVSPGPGIMDVRGVDATSALFVYLLYLHKTLTGTDTLAILYEPNARAALDFILAHNQSADGFFYSSWQQWVSDGQWHLWTFRYTADQADVYLGMQSAWLLYADNRYGQSASLLKALVPTKFFQTLRKRYALGMNENGKLDPRLEGFNGIFPQGYVPWIFGAHENNTLACQWLQRRARQNGAIRNFSLSVDVYALAAASLNQPRPTNSLDWLAATTFDPVDGSVRDKRNPASEKYSNVAGFTVMAFLGFPTLLP